MTGGGEKQIGRAIRGAAPERDSEELRAEDAATAELVARIQAGEQDHFAELYERYFDRVYAYLRVALKDAHEAEDAAQQVFVKLFEALPAYEARRQPFRAWLFVIARNHARDLLAKRSRVDVVEPNDIDRRGPQRSGEERGLRTLDWVTNQDLIVLIDRLPPQQRQVLALRYMLGFEPREIAEILEVSANHVSVLHYRALGFLRRRLTALGREPRRERHRMAGYLRKAPVLRLRRFALERTRLAR
ncbi:MAG: RNA polymerase sigma factor [Solirubrobacterales bacterium]